MRALGDQRQDVVAGDYLAELTMSILAGARMKRPEEGYAIDFVTVALRSVLKQAVETCLGWMGKQRLID